MTYTSSTIDELKHKPVGELNAIFKKAAQVAVMPQASPPERKAADATMTNVRRTLTRPTGPG